MIQRRVAVARAKQGLCMPTFLKGGLRKQDPEAMSPQRCPGHRALPIRGMARGPGAVGGGSDQDAAATTLLMTHRCLPILRSRVNPSFS